MLGGIMHDALTSATPSIASGLTPRARAANRMCSNAVLDFQKSSTCAALSPLTIVAFLRIASSSSSVLSCALPTAHARIPDHSLSARSGLTTRSDEFLGCARDLMNTSLMALAASDAGYRPAAASSIAHAITVTALSCRDSPSLICFFSFFTIAVIRPGESPPR